MKNAITVGDYDVRVSGYSSSKHRLVESRKKIQRGRALAEGKRKILYGSICAFLNVWCSCFLQIQNMEQKIQHETLPLKEEKQLIRDIKQLKYSREQLTNDMGGLDELKLALDRREQTEERLKVSCLIALNDFFWSRTRCCTIFSRNHRNSFCALSAFFLVQCV